MLVYLFVFEVVSFSFWVKIFVVLFISGMIFLSFIVLKVGDRVVWIFFYCLFWVMNKNELIGGFILGNYLFWNLWNFLMVICLIILGFVIIIVGFWLKVILNIWLYFLEYFYNILCIFLYLMMLGRFLI